MLTPHFTYRYLVYVYAAWFSTWAVLHTVALFYSIGLPLQVSLTDALVTNTMIAFTGYITISMMRFYQPRIVIRLVVSVVLALLCILAIQGILTTLSKNDGDYMAFIRGSSFIRFLYAWLMISMIKTISWLWSYVLEQKEIEDHKAAAEKLAREAELSKLRQQLQPHFLFNSLNSISALAGTKPEVARKMVQQLSDFLRGTLRKDDQQLVTLSEEIEHLILYLDIEKVRFGHRLKTEIAIDEKASMLQLPSLLLQPVVENAIKFGLYDTIGETMIRISAQAADNYLLIRVENPYDPTTSLPRQGTGFGLSSIQRRLWLLYGRNDLLTTSKNEQLFVTQIQIPQSL